MNDFLFKFLLNNQFNKNISPLNTSPDNQLIFTIDNIPFIKYRITAMRQGFIIALDFEHELLFKSYSKYIDLFTTLYPYKVDKTDKRIGIYKIVNLFDLDNAFNRLVELTVEKIIQIYKDEFSSQPTDNDHIDKIFDDIYQKDIWGYGSGTGSDAIFLKPYIEWLNKFIKDNKIKTIIDCGCGDWQYMKYINLDGVDYKGYDVSDTIISLNKKNYSKNNIKFYKYDGDFTKLPPADLLICKEVLQHLPDSYINNFINTLPNFKFSVLANLMNPDPAKNNDHDIKIGDYRDLDLGSAPFNLNLKTVMDMPRWDKRFIRIHLLQN